MKALIYKGPKRLEYSDDFDMPRPCPATDELLVRVHSVGICGSDMHAYLGHDERRPPPLILGHEISGHIIGGPRDGAAVCVNPLVSCGDCAACGTGRANLCAERQIISMPPRQGGFAQYIAIPTQNCLAVPDGFDLQKAALAEPMACAWHAVRLGLAASAAQMPKRALVFGGGAIGVSAALCLLANGITQPILVESNPLRRDYLRAHLPFEICEPNTLEKLGNFALIIDGVGYAQTRQAACTACAAGGVIVHIGLGAAQGGLDIRKMTLQEICFIGTYTYTPQDFIDTTVAMFSGQLGALDWFEQRPLAHGAQAFADISAGAVLVPKILLTPKQQHAHTHENQDKGAL